MFLQFYSYYLQYKILHLQKYFKRISGRQKAQAKGKREQQKTVLLRIFIRKGIFEILLGSFGLPESKHRRRKYLHCPDPHPRGAE